MNQAVLYSFRRCPYAMRARVALHYSGVVCELREVVLKNKPIQMLEASSKGTVPVLVLADRVIDESLDIMQWALQQHDPQTWLTAVAGNVAEHLLVRRTDNEFKPLLDRYKYFDRYPEQSQSAYFEQASAFLYELERLLIPGVRSFAAGETHTAEGSSTHMAEGSSTHTAEGSSTHMAEGSSTHMADGSATAFFIQSDQFGALDAAIFPFVRQFAHVDLARFRSLNTPKLFAWLEHCLNSPLFVNVMNKYPAWSAESANGVQFG